LSTPAREEDSIVLCARERPAPLGEDLLSRAARCPALDLAEERLIVAAADARAGEIARRLRASGSEAAVVVGAGGTILGTLSAEDVTEARDSEPARACVEAAIVGVLAEASAMDVFSIMLTRAWTQVSVLSHGHVVGIITARSALAWLAAFSQQEP
jgi:CBS domain-containing protein